MMFFIIHTDYAKKEVSIINNTTLYANTRTLMMDYVATKCNATHIEDVSEVKEIGRYFMVSNDMSSIFIYNAINTGYLQDYFELELIEDVKVVRYEVKEKSYAECLKENLNKQIELPVSW